MCFYFLEKIESFNLLLFLLILLSFVSSGVYLCCFVFAMIPDDIYDEDAIKELVSFLGVSRDFIYNNNELVHMMLAKYTKREINMYSKFYINAFINYYSAIENFINTIHDTTIIGEHLMNDRSNINELITNPFLQADVLVFSFANYVFSLCCNVLYKYIIPLNEAEKVASFNEIMIHIPTLNENRYVNKSPILNVKNQLMNAIDSRPLSDGGQLYKDKINYIYNSFIDLAHTVIYYIPNPIIVSDD